MTPILGDLGALRRDPVAFWRTTAQRGPLVQIRLGFIRRLVVNDAEIARHLLVTRRTNYIKDQRLKRILETGSGEVLATSDGEAWSWRRRLMQPAFGHRPVKRLLGTIEAELEPMLAQWSDGDTVDMLTAMKTLTLRIICRAMFSAGSSGQERALHEAYARLGRGLVRRATQLLRTPLWVPSRDNRELGGALDSIACALRTILVERRADPRLRGDLLDMLLDARDPDGGRGFDERGLIHEMSAIVFAGHDTTAAALGWVLVLLASHPEVAAGVRAEIDAVLRGRGPTADDFRRMPYLRRVVDESMRRFPPLYINSRQAIDDDRVGGYPIPAGSRLLINILGIHHDPRHWPEPEVFEPARFEPTRAEGRHRFAFIPFLGGPRRCLGAPLARAELMVILPRILQRFIPHLPPGAVVEPEAAAVLQPRGPLPMVLEARGRPD